jgi:hypothetical protein
MWWLPAAGEQRLQHSSQSINIYTHEMLKKLTTDSGISVVANVDVVPDSAIASPVDDPVRAQPAGVKQPRTYLCSHIKVI